MLTIPGADYRLCDGLNRRSFLQIGGLALGGLSLPQLLQAENSGGSGGSHKSVIMIFLAGGPPHQDMVDLKPEAPAEYRGEFAPIHSNVPGIDVCEHLPLMAQRMDRLAVIRTLVGSEGQHAAFQCLHGHTVRNQPPGGWPCFGSAVSKLQGPVNLETPACVSLQPKMGIPGWRHPGQPGFAGMAHAPFAPNASGTRDLVLDGMNLQKLRDRRTLLDRIDLLRRKLDASDSVDGMDNYYRQAFDILTSGRLANALDFDQEDAATRDRYGRGSNEPAGYGDAGWLRNEDFLVARRLVEAGARVVTLSFGRWDWHGQPHGTNFDNARDHLPALDQALTALLDDLQERGLERDTSVVVWGEFGRTPLINNRGGRDHWPQCFTVSFAGGGVQGGQVVGASDPIGGTPAERPVDPGDIVATIFHSLGLDPESHLPGPAGRPFPLVDFGKKPILELFG